MSLSQGFSLTERPSLHVGAHRDKKLTLPHIMHCESVISLLHALHSDPLKDSQILNQVEKSTDAAHVDSFIFNDAELIQQLEQYQWPLGGFF